jgi:hypothetical protein
MAKNPNALRNVRSWRDYVVEVRFIVLLPGDRALAQEAAVWLRDPVWGVWLGRKSCIPSSPVLVSEGGASVFDDEECAWRAALRFAALFNGDRAYPAETAKEQFSPVCDAPPSTRTGQTPGTTLRQAFGRPHSSGSEVGHDYCLEWGMHQNQDGTRICVFYSISLESNLSALL